MTNISPAVLAHARGAAERWRAITDVAVDAQELLTGRAILLGLTQNGRISAGGATRLLKARDSWCALTLSRRDDIEAVPALIETAELPDDPWPALTEWVGTRQAAEVTDRARLLGLPAAALAETPPAPPRARRLGSRTEPRSLRGLLVADLSSMWAGPLCGQLLLQAGATVVKVESPARPDGTRSGMPAFFDWMNSGKYSYAVSFDQPATLRALLEAADIVIEGSRPAALARHGLGPEDIVAREGRVWIRITGHGAEGERGGWVAFGDDAAVSGGLVQTDADGPVFCGDAIADPLTGLHGALAVAEALRRGGGELIEMSMAAIAATYAALPATGGPDTAPSLPAAPPSPARPLGADRVTVEHLVSERTATTC